jgi:hypothetical protein
MTETSIARTSARYMMAIVASGSPDVNEAVPGKDGHHA